MSSATGSQLSLSDVIGVRMSWVYRPGRNVSEDAMKKLAALALLGLAGCGDPAGAPTRAAQPEPDLRMLIPIEVGKAYDRGGTRIPVSVTNLTGRSQRYIKIECAIRLDGALIETPFRIWTDVPAGETVTGELLPDAERGDSIDCRPVIAP